MARDDLVAVVRIHEHAETNLLHVVGTADLARFEASLGKGRQEHGCQDRDDGDHDKQLNQGEPAGLGSHSRLCFLASFKRIDATPQTAGIPGSARRYR